jgi:hypothetical protein
MGSGKMGRQVCEMDYERMADLLRLFTDLPQDANIVDIGHGFPLRMQILLESAEWEHTSPGQPYETIDLKCSLDSIQRALERIRNVMKDYEIKEMTIKKEKNNE